MDSTSQHNRLAALRKQAEEALQRHPTSQQFSFTDVQEILHEVQVYQAELEIQNEELRQSQQQLQDSHHRYLDLYDFAPAGYFTVNAEGLIIEANLTGSTLLGVERSALLQQHFAALIVQDDQDTYYLFHKQLTTSQESCTCELRMKRAGGASFYARLEGTSTQDDGLARQYRFVTIDITRRVEAEQALRAAHDELEQRVQERTAELYEREIRLRISEERFRLVLKDSLITVFSQDQNLRYTWIYNTPAFLAHQSIPGKTDADLFEPEDAARLTALKQRVLDEGVRMLQDMRITLNERIYWYVIKIEPLHDTHGTVVGLTGAATDITDYRLTMNEQRLLSQVSNQLITSLDISSMLHNVARLVVDDIANGCIINTLSKNGATEAVTIVHREPQREEILRNWFQPLPEETEEPHPVLTVMQKEHPVVAGVLNNERSFEELTGTWNLPFQQVGIISFLCVPLIARGRTIGAMSFIIDQPGRRYNANQVRIAEELASRVAIAMDNAHLHEMAQHARAEAEAAVRARDHVFRLVSHDLRAPLTAIQGYTHLLQKRIKATDVPDAERFIHGLINIEASATRMTAQLEELLDVATLQAGHPLSLSWNTFDLVALAHHAVEVCQESSVTHSIIIQPTDAQIIIAGDELRLERVITNLLSNAIKYSPQGGKVVVQIKRESHDDIPGAALSVTDQGIGIPAADLPHLFTPFHRASNVSSQMKGTGLGLSSARHIIEQQKGDISVRSEEGVGSTFTIWLPTCQDQQE